MGRVGEPLKDRLKAAGTWDQFMARRDDLRASGETAQDARAMALAESLANEPAKPSSKTPALPPTPAEVAGRSASEAEVVRWVARHIDDDQVSPDDCPDPCAWTLLRQCRQTPGFVSFFFQQVWTKLLPSRAQIESDSGVTLDGSAVSALINRIESLAGQAHEPSDPPTV